MPASVALSALAEKDCIAYKDGTPPLKGPVLQELSAHLGHAWKVVDEHHLEKEFKFKDFKQALEFTNRVGALAESQDHHPDILLTYGKVGLTLSTHSVGGLSENDFILAAKVELLARPM